MVIGICCGLLCSACDAITSVRGTVRDAASQPVEDARIDMALVGDTRLLSEKSDEPGRYRVSLTHGLPAGAVQIRVSKDHYQPATTSVRANRDYECDVRLVSTESRTSASTLTCRELKLRGHS